MLHIPSGGAEINGWPASAGRWRGAASDARPAARPAGRREKNLDLAQAVRRAGWNVVTFNYRGTWGSPGTFSFEGNLADAKAVLAFVRDPAHATALQIDTKKLVLAGHLHGRLGDGVDRGAGHELAAAP